MNPPSPACACAVKSPAANAAAATEKREIELRVFIIGSLG